MEFSVPSTVVASILIALVAGCQAVATDELAPEPVEEGGARRNSLTFAVGEFSEATEHGARFAIEYERRFPEGWGLLGSRVGLGLIADGSSNPVETLLLAAQVVYHPVEPVSLILASGFSDNDDPDTGSDSWLLRMGIRYSLEVAEGVSFGPELLYDILEDNQRKAIAAFALTFSF